MIEYNRLSLKQRHEQHQKRDFVIPTKTKTNAYNKIPKDIPTIHDYADEMVEWVYLNKSVINLDKFPLSKRMSPYRFFKLAEKYPYFEEALEICRYLISEHIQDGWASKELDSSFCKEMLPKYDREYKTWITHRIVAAIEARQAQTEQASNFTIVLDSIETSSRVPERKMEKDEDILRNSNKTQQVST